MLRGGGQLASFMSVFPSSIRRHCSWSPLINLLHFLHLDALSPHSGQRNEAAFQRNPKIVSSAKILEQRGSRHRRSPCLAFGRPWVQPLTSRPSPSPPTHHQKQLFKTLERSRCVITETVFSLTLCEDLLLEFEVDK